MSYEDTNRATVTFLWNICLHIYVNLVNFIVEDEGSFADTEDDFGPDGDEDFIPFETERYKCLCCLNSN